MAENTLAQTITTVLERVNISTAVAKHKDQARKYLGTVAAEVFPRVAWLFLDETTTFRTTRTMTVTSATGDYTVGETVTGGTSTETATVDHWDSTNGLLFTYDESGDFTDTEVITGGTSLVTSTLTSDTETRVYTPVSGRVTNWWSFVDETNDRTLGIIGADAIDALDPDRGETGTVEAIRVAGMDDDTGNPEIEPWRIPSTSGEVIRVRYALDIAAWASTDDDTTMQVLGIPRVFENVLVFGASQLYLEEKRHRAMAETEKIHRAAAMEAAEAWNRRMQGRRRYPPKTYGERQGEALYSIGTDTVTAA